MINAINLARSLCFTLLEYPGPLAGRSVMLTNENILALSIE